MSSHSAIDSETLRRYQEQGWGQSRIGFGFSAALVVIDMQHDFVDEDSPSTCAPMAIERIPAILSLLGAARAAGIPVFHTQGIVKPDLSDLGLWKGTAKRQGRCQIDGTRGAEIVPDLAPTAGEVVIRKTRPSAFFGTDLHQQLQQREVDTLLMAGASMSGCVRATVTDGFSHDYRVSVVRECVVDRSQALVDSNLFDVAAKYADDVGLEEVIEYLSQPSLPDRRRGR